MGYYCLSKGVHINRFTIADASNRVCNWETVKNVVAKEETANDINRNCLPFFLDISKLSAADLLYVGKGKGLRKLDLKVNKS